MQILFDVERNEMVIMDMKRKRPDSKWPCLLQCIVLTEEVTQNLSEGVQIPPGYLHTTCISELCSLACWGEGHASNPTKPAVKCTLSP
jgi:hypothetical protein